MSKSNKPRIGFIGQGFIGKNLADDFERRKYSVVRYALEEPYVENKELISTCDIVFIAVPTPTTPQGFKDTALRHVLPLVGKGKVAVIKSTILPGKTEEMQKEFPHCLVLHAPEFLTEKNAVLDTQKPQRNIVGIPKNTKRYQEAAEQVLKVLPKASFEMQCSAREAEIIKYAGNCYLANRVVFMNALYDIVVAEGASYEIITKAMSADTRIGGTHMKVIDNSGHKGAKAGRGAGGHCFPKDLAALRLHAEETLGKGSRSARLLQMLEDINLQLLCESEKDIDLLTEIYGQPVLQSYGTDGKVKGSRAKKKEKR
ncbi:MAG: UDP-glucose/GDP-mannose dehydrogenase dimerization [Parcubacteria group bacterium GW2011_GWA2_43_11]|nr:MAG: UDP-glucose/GDP-mannose dehydrogenase dimerization [Parcubacteria group bacterium GW2011_GWA2_43_11]